MHRSNHTNSIPASYAQQVSISYILRFAALMLVLSLSLWMFGSQALAGSHTADGGALPACDPNWVVVSSANVTPEATTYLSDVEVLSATDAWAVGSITPIGSGAQAQTLIQHWDGTSWHRVPSPNPGMGNNFLKGVSALSANDIWAVGDYEPVSEQSERTLIMHWNGAAWNTVSSPNFNTDANVLKDVDVVSANDAWAVGIYYAGFPKTLVQHWNGTAWSIVTSPNIGTQTILNSVTAVSANDVWAVGYYVDNPVVNKTLILHWNGSTWTIVASPNQGTGGNVLNGVTALAANDVWAVGNYNNGTRNVTLIQRYNGSAWTIVASPNVGTASNFLFSVDPVSVNDVWAVGYTYEDSIYSTLIQRWNGNFWSTVSSPNVGTRDNNLASIAAGPANNVWAVGSSSDSAGGSNARSLALRWDGSSWNGILAPVFQDSRNNLFDMDAASSNQIWAVGDADDKHEVSKTQIQRWNGSSWSVVPSPNGEGASRNNTLQGVEAVSANDAWAVGYNEDNSTGNDRTLTMRWDGSAWNIVPSPNTGSEDNRLFAVTAVSANDVWAVGNFVVGSVNQTLILHWNGSSWSTVSSPNVGPTHNYLYGVTAVSANDIWAVGSFVINSSTLQTLVMRWNGSAWNVVPSPNVGTGSSRLFDVSAHSANDVWAIGSGGSDTLTMRWDGSAWNIVPSPNIGTGFNALQSVFTVSPTEAWTVGYYSAGANARTLVQRWNGSTWNIVTSPNTGASDNYLWDVTGVPGAATDLWTAGYYQDTLHEQTLVERYNPCVGSPTPVSTAVASSTPTSTYTPAPTQTPGGPTATATPIACTIEFSDVPQGSTFYEFVRCMACGGIINGYTADCETGSPCFRPNNNVTRGQLSKIASNAAAFNEPAGAQQFEDVPAGSTFYDFVWRLADRGHVGGYACGGVGEPCGATNLPYFRPNGNASRGQISKIVANAAGLSDPTGTQLFDDVPPTHTFYDYIQRLANLSVMGGYACGGVGEPCGAGSLPYFRPASNATRGQTSKIVANAFFPDCQTP